MSQTSTRGIDMFNRDISHNTSWEFFKYVLALGLFSVFCRGRGKMGQEDSPSPRQKTLPLHLPPHL